jgi:hypothetical protein
MFSASDLEERKPEEPDNTFVNYKYKKVAQVKARDSSTKSDSRETSMKVQKNGKSMGNKAKDDACYFCSSSIRENINIRTIEKD